MFIIIAGSTVDGTIVPLKKDGLLRCRDMCVMKIGGTCCYSEDITLTSEQLDIITNTLISQAISDLKKKIY